MSQFFFARLSEATPGGPGRDLTRVTVGFGETPATNAEIVPATIGAFAALNLPGGKGLLINGPMSIPSAFAAAHAVGHLFAFIAVWDPKLQRYVVVISHNPDQKPGDLLS